MQVGINHVPVASLDQRHPTHLDVLFDRESQVINGRQASLDGTLPLDQDRVSQFVDKCQEAIRLSREVGLALEVDQCGTLTVGFQADGPLDVVPVRAGGRLG